MNIVEKCQKLINIDSPSGYIQEIQKYLVDFAISNELEYKITSKGNVIIDAIVAGKPQIMVATHVDTLGLMVKSINEDGTLNVTPIGGPIASTINGEYAKVYTRAGQVYNGTIILDSSAAHVYADSNKQVEFKDLRVRLDLEVKNKEQVLDAGIANGDYICYDPKFRYAEGYINSRFLDDKLCAAISLEILEQFATGRLNLKQSVSFAFTMYEEVGHGLAYVPQNINHVIAMDMGCVGSDLDGSEFKVSICAKDSSGPYDYKSISDMLKICNEHKLDYALDIYPFYNSDASAALRGGNDIKATLIGPGIAASHGMERAHERGITNTFKLLVQYLQQN
ncbi:M42 family metallopeptidase [Mollicutes bacterium LVI A0039]|nr:M42 family metallopeptidase [Mollicutes bacterium LVI A0039]